MLKGLILAAAVLGIAAGGTVFGWPYLSDLMTPVPGQVAQHDDPDPNDPDAPKEPPRRTTRTRRARRADTPKKSDLPVKHEPPKPPDRPDPSTKRDTPKPPDLPVTAGPFPRRALAISINDYLFANPINYGMPIAAGTNVQSLVERFAQPTGLHVPATQIGILSDAARVAVPPTEPVIRNTIVNFLKESRAQDRILLLIVGHVVEVKGEPVLVPIDGMTDSKEGTIPLKWVYDQLAACKARAEGAHPRHLPPRPEQGTGAAGQRADRRQARRHAQGAAAGGAGLDGVRGGAVLLRVRGGDQ